MGRIDWIHPAQTEKSVKMVSVGRTAEQLLASQLWQRTMPRHVALRAAQIHNLTAPQELHKFPEFYETRRFTTVSYPKPDKSSLQTPNLYLQNPF